MVDDRSSNSSTLLSAVLESSPEVIVFALDPAYRYLAFNQRHAAAMQAIWGRSIAVGQCMLDVIGDATDRAKARLGFDRALAGESFVVEDAYGDSRLQRLYWQNFMSPIRAADGGVLGLTVFVLNITERRRAELTLQDREAFLSTLLDTMPLPVFVKDLQGRYLRLNAAHAAFFGRANADVLGKSTQDLLPPPLAAQIQAHDHELVAGLATRSFELQVPVAAGSTRDVLFHEALLRDAQGQPSGVVGVMSDITERKATERALALREQEFRTLVEHSSDWVARHGRDLRRLYVNPAFAQAVPGGREALLGRTPVECPGGRTAAEFQRLMSRVFETGRPGEIELFWSPAPELELCTLVSITPEFDEAGQVVSVLTVGRDFTELNASRRKIHQMAFYDSLTGLPNRALFHDRLKQTLADSAWHGQMSALMMIDMDRFKDINDSLGHRAGDQLLRETARRLSSCVRPYDTVARLGGDEFTVVLPNIRETDDLGRIADKLLDQFTRSFTLEGAAVFVSCSIGIALFPQDSTEPEDLLQFADSAMYHAKQAGRNAFKFYSAELTQGAQARLSLEVDLRRALERHELHLHYQPQVEMATGRVVGSEALLRWTHPAHGRVAPDLFIPIAEDTGLIMKIGHWVLQQACQAAALRNGAGRPLHKVAINVSPRQFQSVHFVDDLRQILAQAGCEPAWIELEITERLLLDKHGSGAGTLAELRGMGIDIAIDDFGTGYSALSYLTQFPLDTLKIDRSFVTQATATPGRAGLVGAVMTIARCLGLRVVAEGVETPEQVELLRQQGCEYAQGYWYGRPVDPQAFEALPAVLPAPPPAA